MTVITGTQTADSDSGPERRDDSCHGNPNRGLRLWAGAMGRQLSRGPNPRTPNLGRSDGMTAITGTQPSDSESGPERRDDSYHGNPTLGLRLWAGATGWQLSREPKPRTPTLGRSDGMTVITGTQPLDSGPERRGDSYHGNPNRGLRLWAGATG